MANTEESDEKDLLRDTHDQDEFREAQDDLLRRLKEQGIID